MTLIALECDADEALVKSMGFTRAQITHHYGRSRVLKFVQKRPETIGLVDEDPGTTPAPYLKEFRLLEEKFGVAIYIHPTKKTRVVVLKPQLEGWLLRAASESKVKHKFPEIAREMHKEINTKISALQELLKSMSEAKSPAMIYLKDALSKA